MRRTIWWAALGLAALAVAYVATARWQARSAQLRWSRTLYTSMLGPARDSPEREARTRRRLFDLLQPVPLTNCDLKRFGEPHDGGYLMCANLLGGARAGYSYGIAGYDRWGCDISTTLGIPVHQYDCFDLRQPACPSGRTSFHAECIAASPRVEKGRRFDTLKNQLTTNGDASQGVVLKMDVESAEWDVLLDAPDGVLERIEQMAVEFHGVGDEKFVRTVERLQRLFWVAHLHVNNYSCLDGLEPFPGWAYEVLFINKRIATVDSTRGATDARAPDAPNNPAYRDCQVVGR